MEEKTKHSPELEEQLHDARLAAWALAVGGYQAERLPVWESGDPVRWRWLGPWGAERFNTTLPAPAERPWLPPLDAELRQRLERERAEWAQVQVAADRARWDEP